MFLPRLKTIGQCLSINDGVIDGRVQQTLLLSAASYLLTQILF